MYCSEFPGHTIHVPRAQGCLEQGLDMKGNRPWLFGDREYTGRGQSLRVRRLGLIPALSYEAPCKSLMSSSVIRGKDISTS